MKCIHEKCEYCSDSVYKPVDYHTCKLMGNRFLKTAEITCLIQRSINHYKDFLNELKTARKLIEENQMIVESEK